ncbi:MAG: hypothetical protein IPK60_09775 [Sandaracinaceae bacterium]|nr:hypothetical protein [Sandaracinaceae bacterium]
MSHEKTTQVLVTGFAPWAAHERNPSTDVARAMHGMQLGNVCFQAHAPLPVEFVNAASLALEDARAIGAGAILALGLAAKTDYIRVERRGHNLCTTTEPDAKGRVLTNQSLVATAPATLDTNFDVDEIVATLKAHDLDARVSDDAGGYVCNDLYFRLLAGARLPTLFIHLPAHAHALKTLPTALATALATLLR